MSAELDGAFPDGPDARNAFLIENLGINQAVRLLEDRYPEEYRRIRPWCHRIVVVFPGDDGFDFCLVRLGQEGYFVPPYEGTPEDLAVYNEDIAHMLMAGQERSSSSGTTMYLKGLPSHE